MLGKEITFNPTKDSLHGKILSALVNRITMSDNESGSNRERWKKQEELFQLYKIKTEKDKKIASRLKAGETDYQSVVMPFSYAQLMTAHAYLVSTFLTRDPIFQVDSLNGDGAEKELTLESLLQYQVKGGCMEPEMVVWLFDIVRYGVGVIGNYWDEEIVPKVEIVEVPEIIDGVATGEYRTELQREMVKGYEGSKLHNILPYNYIYDPRVSIAKPNDGEFAGHKFKMSINEIKKKAAQGIYFNVDAVEKLLGTTNTDEYSRWNQTDNSSLLTKDPSNNSVGQLDCAELVVDLIPSDWHLDDSDFPEKWVFTVVGKKIIIGCRPLGSLHNKFPYHVAEHEVDGYKQNSRSLLELAEPFNNILTWLFDSHMYNKRQVMNNQFIYDPNAIVTKDLEDKRPGKSIRLKATAMGRDVRTVISQLPVTDVTAQNINDIQVVERNMQRIAGINDDVAGQSAPSSRRSATEFRGTTSFSSNRLASLAYHISVTGFRSLAKCLISDSQQYYTTEMKVKVAGDNIKGAQSITVNPEDISGQFDISAVDGTLPIDRFSQAQFWLQALGAIQQNPILMAEYRIGDVFAHTARLAGLKGIDKMKIQVMDDETILAMVHAQLTKGGNNGGQQAAAGTSGEGAGGEAGGTASPESVAPLSGLEGLF